MTADFMKGSLGVSGVSGLRLRKSFIKICVVGSPLRTARPSQGRSELRRVRATFDTSSSSWVRRLPKERQRTKPLDLQG